MTYKALKLSFVNDSAVRSAVWRVYVPAYHGDITAEIAFGAFARDNIAIDRSMMELLNDL